MYVGVYIDTSPVYILHLILCINFQEFTKVLSSCIWLYPCPLLWLPLCYKQKFPMFLPFSIFFFSLLSSPWGSELRDSTGLWAGAADLWFRTEGSDQDWLGEAEIQTTFLADQTPAWRRGGGHEVWPFPEKGLAVDTCWKGEYQLSPIKWHRVHPPLQGRRTWQHETHSMFLLFSMALFVIFCF